MVFSRRPITPAPSGVIFNPRIRPATARPRTAAQNPTGPPTIPALNPATRSRSATSAPVAQAVPPPTPGTPRGLPPQVQQVVKLPNSAQDEKLPPSPSTLAKRGSTPSRIPVLPLSGVTYRPPRRKPVPPPQATAHSSAQPATTATMTSHEEDAPLRTLLRTGHLDVPDLQTANKEPSIDFKRHRHSWHPLDSESPVIRDYGMRHSMQDLTNTREREDDGDAIITQEDFDELPGTDHSVGSRHPNRFLANRVDVDAIRPGVGERTLSAVSFHEQASPTRACSNGRSRPGTPVPGKVRPTTALERVLGLGNGGAVKKKVGKKERVKEFFKGMFKRS